MGASSNRKFFDGTGFVFNSAMSRGRTGWERGQLALDPAPKFREPWIVCPNIDYLCRGVHLKFHTSELKNYFCRRPPKWQRFERKLFRFGNRNTFSIVNRTILDFKFGLYIRVGKTGSLWTWSRVIVYCSKLSFYHNDPPMHNGRIISAKGKLATIHYDSAPRPQRSCFAHTTLYSFSRSYMYSTIKYW